MYRYDNNDKGNSNMVSWKSTVINNVRFYNLYSSQETHNKYG